MVSSLAALCIDRCLKRSVSVLKLLTYLLPFTFEAILSVMRERVTVPSGVTHRLVGCVTIKMHSHKAVLN